MATQTQDSKKQGEAPEATEPQATGAGSRTKGLKHERFAGVGTPTLRAWRNYWQGVADGKREANEGDEEVNAKKEVKELGEEIEARTANRSTGGPTA